MEFHSIKPQWKKTYTMVLIANIIYVVLFYLITISFS